MKIIVPRAIYGKKRFWYSEDEAELLPNIAPHLADVASFAVLRPTRYFRFPWGVVHIETGFSVGGGESRSEAIANATNNLDAEDAESFLDKVNRTCPSWVKQ